MSVDRDERSDTFSSYSGSDRYLSDEESAPNAMYVEEDDLEPSLASVIHVATSHATPQAPLIATSPTPGPSSAPDPIISCAPITPLAPMNLTPPPEIEQQSTVLPDEILEMLGQSKAVEEPLGEKIPKEISERWGKILLDGLAKEQKELISKQMLIPENFLLARAPKLNPEVSAVLTDPVKNRDKRLEKAQNQLGTAIAGLVNLTKDLIKSDMNKLDIIKRISEISQILLDLHFEESVNRRKLIVPLLDKCFWSAIQGVKRETYLFGDKLGETIKTTKDIEKTGQQIKKPATSRPNLRRPAPSGNVRFPPRQQTNPRPAAASAPSQYYEPPPPPSTRRSTIVPQPQPPRARRPPANQPRDRRRR